MKEVAEQISEATGAAFRYVEVSLEDKLQEFRDNGVPEPAVQVIREQLVERGRHPESHVRLEAHQAFDVEPTSFAGFARRNAAKFLAQTR